MRLILLFHLALSCALAPAQGAEPVSDRHRDSALTLGLYAHVRSTELLKKFAPIRRYLEASMASMGVARRVEMRIYRNYREAIDALAAGEVDFARYGPVSYVLAKKKNPAVRLLAMESNHGRKSFNGVVFVPENSEVRSVGQLRGKRMAFGSRMSTTGRYLAQAALMEAGIKASDLGGHSYLGRHDKVAFAVAAEQFDAGTANENTFERYAKNRGLRKILEFPCVTKPWVAREALPDDVFAALRAALMGLDDPGTLRAIKRTGFLPPADSDYDLIREAMDLAREFDLTTLQFGTYASETPSILYAKVRPILEDLEVRVDEMGMTVRFEVKIYPSYARATDALVKGEVDMARLGAASYVLAKRANPGVHALAMEDKNGLPAEMLIVAGDGSGIRTLRNLEGRSFAFGDPNSTEGRYFAQAELVREGMHASDLEDFDYLGRHDRVAAAVARGKYDAGAIRDTALTDHGDGSRLRVIRRLPVPQKTWMLRAGIDAELSEYLRSGLLAVRDPGVLSGIQRTGFVEVDDTMFEKVVSEMKQAGRFQTPQ